MPRQGQRAAPAARSARNDVDARKARAEGNSEVIFLIQRVTTASAVSSSKLKVPHRELVVVWELTASITVSSRCGARLGREARLAGSGELACQPSTPQPRARGPFRAVGTAGRAVRALPGGQPEERPGYGGLTGEQALGAGGQWGECGRGLDAEHWSPDGDHRGAVGVHPPHGCGACLGVGPPLV